MTQKQAITINSTLLYVLSFLLTTVVHEWLHALVGWYFDSSPVLHHNYVEHFATANLSNNQIIAIALSGPLVSLLQGILAGLTYLNIKKKSHGLWHLFILWVSVLGFFNFLGYLMTGFLFDDGDIGRAYQLANIPFWIQVVLAIGASIGLLFIAYKMTAPYLRFSFNNTWVIDGRARKSFSFHILLLPWILGSVMITFLYLPIVALVSIIYPIMSGMIFIFPWQNANRIMEVKLATEDRIGTISYAVLGIVIGFALIFKLILAPGIAL